MWRCATLAVIASLVVGVPAFAQHEHVHDAPATGWAWSADGTIFLTANLQERRFRDFHQVESQNWFMGTATRRLGPGALTLHGMLSLEPLTLRDLGTSQAFQTGETFGGAPLIDYQHPHDLIMGLSAGFARPVGRATLIIRGGLVDAPALGPTPFMHRATGTLHPTVPLSHHQLDATHISHGAMTAGVQAGPWLLETSAFRGREADEDRLDLDLGALDSWAARAGWARGGTRAQVSVGWLNEPEASEPGDVTRLTASVEHAGLVAGRAGAVTLAWGQNRETFSNETAWLAEATLAVWRGTAYLRGEIADKHILEAGGFHPPGLAHPHMISTVGALTGGYTVSVLRRGPQSLAIGADITGHRVPAELVDAYGHPWSVHLFARWSLTRR